MEGKELLARVAQSIAGRDTGKKFIVIKIIDENYVLIADGKLRTQEKPKKKKVKHLLFKDTIAEEIKTLLMDNKNVNHNIIKKFLQSNDIDKEV